jgi:hypothetical protein
MTDVVYSDGIYGCDLSLFILLCRAAKKSVYSEVQITTTSSTSPGSQQLARPSNRTLTSLPMEEKVPTKQSQLEN